MAAHSLTLYRGSKLGDALVDALEELIKEEKISGDLAMKVLTEFDQSIYEALNQKVAAKTTFKGKLDTYRYCDNVWTFIVSDATFKTNPTGTGTMTNVPEVKVDRVKIVCVDNKLLQPT